MLHLPLLRAGRPYRSLDTVELTHVATGEPVARLSQANRGLIQRDLAAAATARERLRRLTTAELLEISAEAARLFVEADLPVDPVDGTTHSPEQYVRALSQTTGFPLALARANMEKIRYVLAEMDTVLGGLTRGLDLTLLDSGFGRQHGRTVSYRSEADVLGVVLPSNSPGVHSLWLPAIPLKVPLALKPGTQEPWTPMRVAQAFIAAGCPAEALGFYPTDHGGATEILLGSSRSMLFGDENTVRGWRNDPRVQLHGPGWSKVLLGSDAAERFKDHLDLIVTSIAENGGRSCLNASAVFTASHGRELAEALAVRLAAIEPRALEDPEARLAAFPSRAAAERVSQVIDQKLQQPGAEDLTARHYSSGRVVEIGGVTFLRPTLVWCEDPAHPLASVEYLFPFAAVVELPQAEIVRRIGSTLVATAITEDEAFKGELLAARHVDRLNLGPVPTSRVSWDQPHEGNLFEHLYRQRAFQAVGA